jgi:IclR family acetate operon transcriptional repressor
LSSRNRSLAILALLAQYPAGLGTREIAERLSIPFTATQRLCASLDETGYLHSAPETAGYRLSVKLAALGLAYLGASGVTDLVQPILDDLAKRAGELVRLAVVESDSLTWVSKAQGARSGLLYDPDAGAEVYLPATANGLAWLSCVDDQDALRLIEKQGIGRPGFGPNAPEDMKALLAAITKARHLGYATVTEAYEPGTSAMAAPIRRRGSGAAIGTVSIAGPTIRLTAERMREMSPWLKSSATELGAAAASSPLFNS